MSIDPNVVIRDSSFNHHHHCRAKCISWSAIISGALVAIGLTFLLNLFCISIGLSVVSTDQEGVTSLAIGGFIGLIISTIVAMFTAGSVAGYLARPYCFKRHLGILYGFLAWCLALVLTVLLAGSMTELSTSYQNYINNGPDAVKVVNNDTTPAVTTTTKPNATTEVTVNAQKVVNNVGYAAFLVFVLFFIGAVSSSFGGYCGMVCRCKHDDVECDGEMLRRKI